MKHYFNSRGNALLFSCIAIVVLLVSSMTAVAQTHGSIAVKKLKDTHQTRQILHSSSVLKQDKSKVDFPLSSLSKNILKKNAKKGLFSLLKKLKNKMPALNSENKKLTNDHRSKLSRMIIIFAEYLQKIAQHPSLESNPSVFDAANQKIQQVANSKNIDDKKTFVRAQSVLKDIRQLTKNQKNKDFSGILTTIKSDLIELQTILRKALQSKPDEQMLGRNLKEIFTHYQSKVLPTTPSVANSNLTTILIIVAIVLLVGGFIIFSPIIMPVIGAVITVLGIVAAPYLLALIPLLGGLITAMIGGGIIGLVLAAFGIMLLLLAFLGVAALATAIVLTIIIVLVLLLILLSILLPTIGLLIAGIGLIIGGIVAALPILGPILIPIITIAIIAVVAINFVSGGSIFGWIYDKLPESLAQIIASLCETLYAIPVLGPLLATLLPGLPWPESTAIKRDHPISRLLFVSIFKQFLRYTQPSKHASLQ